MILGKSKKISYFATFKKIYVKNKTHAISVPKIYRIMVLKLIQRKGEI